MINIHEGDYFDLGHQLLALVVAFATAVSRRNA
jgi:hypothetical protein